MILSLLLDGFGWLKSAFAAILGFVTRNPWPAACIALAALAALTWHGGNVARHERDTARAAIAQMTAASQKAGQLALAQRAADEHHYQELATNADTQHTAELADARDSTARFIAAHRLRPATAAGPGGNTAAQAEGGSTGIPDDTATGAVVVDEGDVKTCAEDYSYAQAAYEWAMSLGK